jgi:hypothetical protein
MKSPDLRNMTKEEMNKLFLMTWKGADKTTMTATIMQEAIEAFAENREPKDIEFKMMSVKI